MRRSDEEIMLDMDIYRLGEPTINISQIYTNIDFIELGYSSHIYWKDVKANNNRYISDELSLIKRKECLLKFGDDLQAKVYLDPEHCKIFCYYTNHGKSTPVVICGERIKVNKRRDTLFFDVSKFLKDHNINPTLNPKLKSSDTTDEGKEARNYLIFGQGIYWYSKDFFHREDREKLHNPQYVYLSPVKLRRGLNMYASLTVFKPGTVKIQNQELGYISLNMPEDRTFRDLPESDFYFEPEMKLEKLYEKLDLDMDMFYYLTIKTDKAIYELDRNSNRCIVNNTACFRFKVELMDTEDKDRFKTLIINIDPTDSNKTISKCLKVLCHLINAVSNSNIDAYITKLMMLESMYGKDLELTLPAE